jgi:hypothetical protein
VLEQLNAGFEGTLPLTAQPARACTTRCFKGCAGSPPVKIPVETLKMRTGLRLVQTQACLNKAAAYVHHVRKLEVDPKSSNIRNQKMSEDRIQKENISLRLKGTHQKDRDCPAEESTENGPERKIRKFGGM